MNTCLRCGQHKYAHGLVCHECYDKVTEAEVGELLAKKKALESKQVTLRLEFSCTTDGGENRMQVIARDLGVWASGRDIADACKQLGLELTIHRELVLATPDEKCAPDLLQIKRLYEKWSDK